eukprot:TRINITY_DN12026_c0_g1_i1.p1 TRINITY_DN12026_c0_g1~~TRINITY_DN12026_c0_g1_i1.p1  ORF type:complete len:1295 (-),score=261.38 TRINITY_DN12026_c0_g1_i1:152-3895(-)
MAPVSRTASPTSHMGIVCLLYVASATVAAAVRVDPIATIDSMSVNQVASHPKVINTELLANREGTQSTPTSTPAPTPLLQPTPTPTAVAGPPPPTFPPTHFHLPPVAAEAQRKTEDRKENRKKSLVGTKKKRKHKSRSGTMDTSSSDGPIPGAPKWVDLDDTEYVSGNEYDYMDVEADGWEEVDKMLDDIEKEYDYVSVAEMTGFPGIDMDEIEKIDEGDDERDVQASKKKRGTKETRDNMNQTKQKTETQSEGRGQVQEAAVQEKDDMEVKKTKIKGKKRKKSMQNGEKTGENQEGEGKREKTGTNSEGERKREKTGQSQDGELKEEKTAQKQEGKLTEQKTGKNEEGKNKGEKLGPLSEGDHALEKQGLTLEDKLKLGKTGANHESDLKEAKTGQNLEGKLQEKKSEQDADGKPKWEKTGLALESKFKGEAQTGLTLEDKVKQEKTGKSQEDERKGEKVEQSMKVNQTQKKGAQGNVGTKSNGEAKDAEKENGIELDKAKLEEMHNKTEIGGTNRFTDLTRLAAEADVHKESVVNAARQQNIRGKAKKLKGKGRVLTKKSKSKKNRRKSASKLSTSAAAETHATSTSLGLSTSSTTSTTTATPTPTTSGKPETKASSVLGNDATTQVQSSLSSSSSGVVPVAVGRRKPDDGSSVDIATTNSPPSWALQVVQEAIARRPHNREEMAEATKEAAKLAKTPSALPEVDQDRISFGYDLGNLNYGALYGNKTLLDLFVKSTKEAMASMYGLTLTEANVGLELSEGSTSSPSMAERRLGGMTELNSSMAKKDDAEKKPPKGPTALHVRVVLFPSDQMDSDRVFTTTHEAVASGRFKQVLSRIASMADLQRAVAVSGKPIDVGGVRYINFILGLGPWEWAPIETEEAPMAFPVNSALLQTDSNESELGSQAAPVGLLQTNSSYSEASSWFHTRSRRGKLLQISPDVNCKDHSLPQSILKLGKIDSCEKGAAIGLCEDPKSSFRKLCCMSCTSPLKACDDVELSGQVSCAEGAAAGSCDSLAFSRVCCKSCAEAKTGLAQQVQIEVDVCLCYTPPGTVGELNHEGKCSYGAKPCDFQVGDCLCSSPPGTFGTSAGNSVCTFAAKPCDARGTRYLETQEFQDIDGYDCTKEKGLFSEAYAVSTTTDLWDCAEICNGAPGCVAFDLVTSDVRGGRDACRLSRTTTDQANKDRMFCAKAKGHARQPAAFQGLWPEPMAASLVGVVKATTTTVTVEDTARSRRLSSRLAIINLDSS